ncbi:transferase activity, transferring phosphorus-containing groups protein [[Candida] boidinii]|nr:transferase activity, transferring phosphorus-containing groups protein [[Candida] boidinii]OWB83035.1 transferase activity, transferring phosphorus-containing groups protein [[Candida] boidinii]GMG00369.1 unnamed protein product [[Candida] boidinii]
MITIIGSLNYDFVTFTSRVPDAGETIQGESFEQHIGGKGLNEAIAASRLLDRSEKNNEQSGDKPDREVRMWGKVGNDMFGDKMLKFLEDSKVKVDLVEKLDGVSSGSATILVETLQQGENRIVIIPGANGHLKPDHLEFSKTFENAKDGDFVIIQNEFPVPLESVNWIATNKPELKIAYNPSPFKKELLDADILDKLSYLIVNEGEAIDLINSVASNDRDGDDDFASNLDQLHKIKTEFSKISIRYAEKLISIIRKILPNPELIITLGSKGCFYTENISNVFYQSSCKVANVIDTTGAGDTFLGGVVSQLHNGNSMKDSIKFATVASSLVVQKKGAAESVPLHDEVLNEMKTVEFN